MTMSQAGFSWSKNNVCTFCLVPPCMFPEAKSHDLHFAALQTFDILVMSWSIG